MYRAFRFLVDIILTIMNSLSYRLGNERCLSVCIVCTHMPSMHILASIVPYMYIVEHVVSSCSSFCAAQCMCFWFFFHASEYGRVLLCICIHAAY